MLSKRCTLENKVCGSIKPKIILMNLNLYVLIWPPFVLIFVFCNQSLSRMRVTRASISTRKVLIYHSYHITHNFFCFIFFFFLCNNGWKGRENFNFTVTGVHKISKSCLHLLFLVPSVILKLWDEGKKPQKTIPHEMRNESHYADFRMMLWGKMCIEISRSSSGSLES